EKHPEPRSEILGHQRSNPGKRDPCKRHGSAEHSSRIRDEIGQHHNPAIRKKLVRFECDRRIRARTYDFRLNLWSITRVYRSTDRARTQQIRRQSKKIFVGDSLRLAVIGYKSAATRFGKSTQFLNR